MGRGKSVHSVEDFLKEPYLPIIELFLETKNRVLLLKELRYLLLEDHGLQMITEGTTRGEDLVDEKMFFRDGEKSFKVIRSILQREGGLLRNTTGKNKGRPMNTNGLNKLLQTMMSASGPKILKKVKDRYQLVGNPFHLFVRAEREKRILSCPDRMVSELGLGLTIYNLPLNKKLVKQLKRREELYEGLRSVQEEVLRLWARRKVSLFIGKLKTLTSLHENGNFLGYCSEMVGWFVESSILEEIDFREEHGEILKIAKDKRTREEAKAYGKKIRACKEALKKSRTDIDVSYPKAEEGRAIGSADAVDVSVLSVPSILSAEEDIGIENVIRVLVGNGMIGEPEGELLLQEQEMSKMYRKRGLDAYLSSATLSEEPIIVIESQ